MSFTQQGTSSAIFESHWGLLSFSESKFGLQSIFRAAFKRQCKLSFVNVSVLPTYDGMDSDCEQNFIAENGLLIRSPVP